MEAQTQSHQFDYQNTNRAHHNNWQQQVSDADRSRATGINPHLGKRKKTEMSGEGRRQRLGGGGVEEGIGGGKDC